MMMKSTPERIQRIASPDCYPDCDRLDLRVKCSEQSSERSGLYLVQARLERGARSEERQLSLLDSLAWLLLKVYYRLPIVSKQKNDFSNFY